MSDIHAPTLVVHGSDDPMFPLPHGEALAHEIPGAVLLVVDDMGHERPTPDRLGRRRPCDRRPHRPRR